jgi:hypothetical protein
MKAGTLEYRCRRCGEVFTGSSGPVEMVLIHLTARDRWDGPGGPVLLRDIHTCSDGLGLADLIGARLGEPV